MGRWHGGRVAFELFRCALPRASPTMLHSEHGTTTASVLEVAFPRDLSHLDTDEDKKNNHLIMTSRHLPSD